MTLEDLFGLRGSRAVVTGGGRGLGRGITEALLTAGADVVVLQRVEPPRELFDLAADRGRALDFRFADLAQVDRLPEMVEAVLEDGPVDILVNNAGAIHRTAAADFPLDEFDLVLDLNLRAVFRLCQLFGRPMLERRAGRIVNLASLLSFQGGIRVPAYAASKGAVAQLTKALANEWAASGVNVNAVAPGYMETDLNADLIADPVRSRQILDRIPAGRWGAVQDIGNAVLYLCSPAARYVHGHVLAVDGGWLGR